MTAVRNPHQAARRLIQLELDGLLEARDLERLNAHLGECADCRKFACQLRGLDRALRLDSAVQREAAALTGFALQPIPIRKRAKMNPRLIQSFANTLVSLVLLAALAAGLIWLFGMQTRQATPVVHPVPSPTPTQAPMPEVNDRAQIIAALTSLAERELAATTGTAWIYSVSRPVASAQGELPGAQIETWAHVVDGECREALTISADGPRRKELFNLQVGLPDGTFGDLVALRRGETESLASDWSCAILAADTDSGRLAARLETGTEQLAIKGPNQLKQVRAWYESQDDRPVLVVEAVFSAEGSTPEVQRETRRFDLQTGRMLEEHIEMEWADGSPFGSFARKQTTQILTALPAEVETLFQEAAAELIAISTAATLPQPTGTPLTAAEVAERFAALEALESATADAPLAEQMALEAALRELYQRYLEWASQPGWIIFRPLDAGSLKWDLTYTELLHNLPDGGCELLTYYVKDGVLLPQEIRLTDGRWGLIGSVQDGIFTEGGRDGKPCRSPDLLSLQRLSSLIDSAVDFRSGAQAGRMQAWVEIREGRPVVVIYQDEVYQGVLPSTMDPDTRRLEPETRSEQWTFFDLETGAFAGAAYQAYLQNGKVFGEPFAPGGPLSDEATRLEPLPDDLAQVFADAIAGMEAYLANHP